MKIKSLSDILDPNYSTVVVAALLVFVSDGDSLSLVHWWDYLPSYYETVERAEAWGPRLSLSLACWVILD